MILIQQGENPCHVFGQFRRGSCLSSREHQCLQKNCQILAKSNPNHIFHQRWCWVSWLLNGLAWRMAQSCYSQVNHRGGQALFAHGWFLEPTPSAPQKWEHCRWSLTQITDSVSPSFFLDLHCCWRVSQQQCSISLTQSPQQFGLDQLKHQLTLAYYSLIHSHAALGPLPVRGDLTIRQTASYWRYSTQIIANVKTAIISNGQEICQIATIKGSTQNTNIECKLVSQYSARNGAAQKTKD